MGIKQLGKFLKSSCPSAMNSHSPAAEYKDQTVAIDVSCCLYQCITAMGDTPRGVQPGSELDTSHIAGLLRRSIRLLELGIKPIFIFDGEAPMMKSHVLQQREKNRAKSRELLEEAQAMGDQEAMKRYGARIWCIVGSTLSLLLLGLALQWEFLGPLLLSSFSERSEQPALTEVISRLDALERNVLELQEGLTILREKLILDKSVKKKPPGWFKRRPGPNRTGDRMGKRKTMSPECAQFYTSLLPVTDGRNTTCRRFHFVHVGKNGGTALESWLTENHLECLIAPISFGHVDMEVAFPKRMRGTCYLTFVRDPVERYVSGFLSRWREGCPAHCTPWTRAEERVFQMFQTPNDLAEAFSSDDPLLQKEANMAHATIFHLYRGFASYFPYGKTMMPYVIYAGLTCHMDTDAVQLLRAMGLPKEMTEKLTPVSRVHENPEEHKHLHELSPVAMANVRKKVHADYEIMRLFAQEGLLPSENVSALCK
ncbi:unnamed protein product [Durusdinium trenchii]